MGLEDAHDPVGPGLAQQSPKRLEDRQIRLRRSVVLEARAARDQQIRIRRGAGQKCVEHRGLADAGFTGEEHELTLAGARACEPVLELPEHTVAANQCLARISRRWDLGLTGTGGDEAVAPTRHGLDEGRRRRIVTERATNLQDDHLENTVGDVGLSPPRSQQLLLGDQLPAVLDQPAQDTERLRGKGHHLATAQQLLGSEIQTKLTETQASISLHRRGTVILPRSHPRSHVRSIVRDGAATYCPLHTTKAQPDLVVGAVRL